MTREDFLAFYPQFGTVIPEVVLTACLGAANLRFRDFDEDAEEARRLYVAHRLTLYARGMPLHTDAGGGAVSGAALAAAGDGGRVTGKRVDDVQITYSAGGQLSAGAWGLADLAETLYGQQLMGLLRMHAYPRYVP